MRRAKQPSPRQLSSSPTCCTVRASTERFRRVMTADAASLWRTLMLPDAQFVMIAPPSAEALATAVSSSLVVLRRIAIINSISIATPFCSFSTPFSRLCKDAEPTSTCAVPWEKKHSKEAASQHTFSGHAFERKNMVAHKQNSHTKRIVAECTTLPAPTTSMSRFTSHVGTHL